MIRVADLGLLHYPDYLALGRELVLLRADNAIPDLLLFATHPPVITQGLQSSGDELIWDEATRSAAGLETIPIERGGNTTYHGPDQQMLYPVVMLDLGQVHTFVGNLQEVVVNASAALGVNAYRRLGFPGVWTEAGKLASLGIAIKRRVTLHGIALNCDRCTSGGFEAIIPCGLREITMTSLEQETGYSYGRAGVRAALAQGWETVFGARVEAIDPSELPLATLLAGRSDG